MIKAKPKQIPSSPGVYFFKDRRGKNLYIGKAANLKNRLGSYFRNLPRDPRLTKMLEKSTRVDWQETPSEIEALILESQLIKKNRPAFNIALRDDKQYFYVIFTKEKFSRIYLTHQPHSKYRHIDISSFVGPFTEGAALRTTLKLLRRVFPYCTCKQKHYRRCLNTHLGRCVEICCLKNQKNPSLVYKSHVASGYDRVRMQYIKNIRSIKKILTGKKTSLIKQLKKEMGTAAKKEDFAEAIQLRDRIVKLEQVFENARIIRAAYDRTNILGQLQDIFNLPRFPQRIEGYDISNIQGLMATGAMIVFTDGQPDKNEYRKFKIRRILPSEASGEGGLGDTHMLKEVLRRRFNHPEWIFPDLILIDGGKAQLNAALDISTSQNIPVPIIALTKDERHRGHHVLDANKKEPIALKNLPPTVANLILQIDSEAHRFAISYYRHLHRKKLA